MEFVSSPCDGKIQLELWCNRHDITSGLPDDAGDISGQGLIAGLMIGQGLLTRQAESSIVLPIRRVLWIDPINNGRMVHDSIAQWNGARLRAGLW